MAEKTVNHSDFIIGGTFWCGDRQWRCTDIGTRTIIAMRIDCVQVADSTGGLKRLSRGDAKADGWFNGPPYAVAEVVFDEYDLEVCTLAASDGGADARSS
ncbi:hypothetical protein [Telmatospirillum sp.]|uniref:hypothetical protein n=1 Tax=Telmatospirillum sp. TaxID=2079197 RepID=UPI0028465C0D|nr:hypothetical protein [Telmatospirillum sp.]MDR3440585.1 hypothetical protein [Telmatospirillum sp.]